MAHPPACSSSTWNSSPSATDAAASALSFTADRGDDAHRLDLAVLRRGGLHGLSRAGIQRLIAAGGIRVNQHRATRPAQRLRSGDVVHVAAPPPAPRIRPSAEALPLSILFEDDDLVVLVKPPGQVVHPSHRNRSGTTLNALLGHAAAQPTAWQPHLVQRLDKGTSGLVVAAKSGAMQTALQHAGMQKDYLALVWGRPSPATGHIDTALGRDPLDRRRVIASGTGAAALTEYRTLARSRGRAAGTSLMLCRLVTGRTHQLRVHLADRGWPIVGDPVYRVQTRLRLADPRAHRAATSFDRQALHAWRLTFVHPRTGATMTLQAPLPSDLATLLADLAIPLPHDPHEPPAASPRARSRS